MILIKQKSDIVGIYASSFCPVHCFASPFIFITQTSRSSHSHNVSSWWGLLDFVFLIISFFFSVSFYTENF
ncbi:MerC domain-containing protein [Polaribacter atrinae]|uniref:MerC domain-containing protein n=1 Tax=Polaribacter atrinae TaxID=1333662 RepID=UPI0030FB3FB6